MAESETSAPILSRLVTLFLWFVAFTLGRISDVVRITRKRKEKTQLESQLREYRKELSKISQTDEFAKYSKVQRKLRADTDKYNTLRRDDLELSLKLNLAFQIVFWLAALVYAIRLAYHCVAYVF